MNCLEAAKALLSGATDEKPVMESLTRVMSKYKLNKFPTYSVSSVWRREIFDVGAQKRLRYRGDFPIKYYGGDKVRCYFSSFYDYVLDKAGVDLGFDVSYLIQDMHLAEEVSAAAFLHGEDFSRHWRYLCHLKKLNDYSNAMTKDELEEYIREWVKPKEHCYLGDSFKFFTVFKQKVSNWLGRYFIPKKNDLTIEDYANNPTLWACNGSGFWLGERWEDTSIKEYSKTKWLRAWTTSPDKIRCALLGYNRFFHKAHQKPEISKSRLVVAADLPSYIKMKFVWDKTLKSSLSSWKCATIMLNNVGKFNMWDRLTRNWNGFRVPIDQEQFDFHQPKECILEIISQIKSRYDVLGWDDISKVLDTIIFGLQHATVLNPNGGEINYENGVMSGWFWTAFLDTVLNEVIYDMAKDVCTSLGYACLTTESNHQGDDVQTEIISKDFVDRISLIYRSLGFIVNNTKFFVSVSRDEYLRRVITRGEVSGYPARSVTNILTSSPERQVGEVRDLATRLSQWKRLSDRLGCMLITLPIITDLSRMSKTSREIIIRWLRTPRTLGGGGVGGQHNIDGVHYKVNYVKEERDVDAQIPPGLLDFRKFWGLESNAFAETLKFKKLSLDKSTMVFEKVELYKTTNLPNFQIPISDGILHSSKYIKPVWPDSVGQSLGPLQSRVEPVNSASLTVYSGFTGKLLEQLNSGKLSISTSLLAGYSEEYCSTINNCVMGHVLGYLSAKHRATIIDFYKCSLKIELLHWRARYLSSE